MRRSEVDVRDIRPGNEGEQSRSRIEVVRSLTKVGGTQYNIIVCKMRVLCKYK